MEDIVANDDACFSLEHALSHSERKWVLGGVFQVSVRGEVSAVCTCDVNVGA